MSFNELNDNQRRIYIDTVQLYQAYPDAIEKNRSYTGGMHWKKVKGKEYLFRSRGRHGHGESLGPRSPETEEMFNNFQRSNFHEWSHSRPARRGHSLAMVYYPRS